jgi:hypothetical protein
MVIRRIGPWSVARIYGALSAVMGLLAGVVFALISTAGAAFAPAGEQEGIMGLMFGVGAVVVLPVFYGILGLIVGALGAVLYNLFAAAVGGIELDIS